MARFGRIALKTLLWILVSIVVLILLVIILIQVPAVQNILKNKAVAFIENKIHTKVEIGHITLGLPKLIVLEDVYFEDQKRDTLLAGDKLKVNVNLFGLLHHEVNVDEIDLEGITTHITRGPDSVFNFDYIIKAFAGGPKTPPQPADTTSSMKFSISDVNLDSIRVSYQDAITGYNLRFMLGHFDTHITRFDLDKMAFTIPRIAISGIDTRIVQSNVAPAPARPDTAASKPLNMSLKLGKIDISKIKLYYGASSMTTSLNLGHLLVDMNNIDLKHQKIGINSIELNNTRAGLTLAAPPKGSAATKKDTATVTTTGAKGWAFTLDKLNLSNDNVRFDNDAQKPIAKGLDYFHLNIRGLNADAENISYNPDTISGKINSFRFADKSGLVINQLRTKFFYGPKNAYLNNLLLQTPHTLIQKQIQVRYPSIASLSSNPGKLFINADLADSRLDLHDVLLLMPTLDTLPPFKTAPNAIFRFNGRIIGRVNDLHIPGFELSGLSNTHVKVSGAVSGLPAMNKANFNLDLADLTTSSADISKMASPGMIPSSVSIPAELRLKGTFKGGMYNFTTRMGLRSSYGAIDLNATLKNGRDKANATYSAQLKADSLNAGAFIKQPQTVGKVSLTAHIAGRSLDPKKATLKVDANVSGAYVKGYNYRDLKMNITAKQGIYAGKLAMGDPNIHFSLAGKADLSGKYPAVNAVLNIDSLDLQKLNLSKNETRIRGKIVADVPTANPDYLNGHIKLSDFLLVQNGKATRIDSVSLVSTANADSSTIRLKAPMLYAHMAGKYTLTGLGPAIQDVIAKYYNTSVAAPDTAKTAQAKYPPQQMKFDIRLVKTPLTAQLIPDLKRMDPVLIAGQFNSKTGLLTVNGTMPKVIYGTDYISNVKLGIHTTARALDYSLTAGQVKMSSSVNLLYTSITGSAYNNKLNLDVRIHDASKKQRYRIAGVFSILPNEYQFSLLPDGLMLDYKNWTVSGDNAIEFGSKGLLAKDFAISNGGQELRIASDAQTMNAPMTVGFKNFRIETLTRAAEQDSLQVGGVINGDVHLNNLQNSMTFTSALSVNDFNFKQDTVGNISLKVNNQTKNAYAADVRITGGGNQVNLAGTYYTSPDNRFDMNLDIVSLKAKGIEGFTFGNIHDASGTLSGKLRITGTPSAPVVRGDVGFNKVAFNVSMLNSYFTMPNERITFNNDGILFNDFTLVDSLGNKAVVAGTVYTKTFRDFAFGLDITARNFRVANSSQDNNKLYYGKLYVDSRIKIRGNMTKPVVDAELTVNPKTDLTIVLPEQDPSVQDREGVVEVINPHAPKEDSIYLSRQLDSLKKTQVSGLDISATIRINKAARFTVIVDQMNGDVVKMRGEAQLSMTIDPSGKISLTGTYTIEQGSYDLSYASVNRKFLFKKGSTITWTGDPTQANIDMTAVYVAKVPPIDLVSDQLGTSQNTTMYKQKLPFHVELMMKNELLKPDISFNILLPDSSYTVGPEVVSMVNTRLDQIRQDPNELNKQVLGVLVLGHFIGDNPLQSQGGSEGISGAIRSSVSALLSDQLNRLAGNLIGGIQLSFDLTSGTDYSTGTAQNRTDLNVGLSKQFLNDRVTVTVGNNFNLEGQNQPGQKSADIAGNVSVNYKLTKDGRYMVRVYRRDEYIVIEGEVVETGVGFTITYDFNKFKQLFGKKTPREKRVLRQMKEERKKQRQERKKADEKPDSTATETEPVSVPQLKST